MSGYTAVKTVIIGNDREFFSPVDKYVPSHLRDEYYESDLDEADMDIMWEGDDKIVIMPRPLNPAYIREITEFFGYTNFSVISPVETISGLCLDILKDPNVMAVLVAAIRSNPDIQIIPFGNSPEFFTLAQSLRELGLVFQTPETPRGDDMWTVTYLDTKIGSRELLIKAASLDNQIVIPHGFVVPDIATARQLALYFYKQRKGMVFKANQGGSGIGVNVYPPDKVGTLELLTAVLDQLSNNPLYTGEEPFIIEEYISPDFAHHGVFPSVDARITPMGEIVIEAIDAMVIQHDQNEVGFFGCVAGVGLFTPDQSQQLESMARTVGSVLREYGYRGWFDTDYILTTDGLFVPTEANLRSTSMRYMVEIGNHIFGPRYLSICAMRSNDKYIRNNLEGITHEGLKAVLAPILFPIKNSHRGLIITESVRSKYGRGKFGYLIVGDSQDDTKRIEAHMDYLLSNI